jgi:hypothetical protein
MERYHPQVTVHLREGWSHGSLADPTNRAEVVHMLSTFLAGTDVTRSPSQLTIDSGTLRGNASEAMLDTLGRGLVGSA